MKNLLRMLLAGTALTVAVGMSSAALANQPAPAGTTVGQVMPDATLVKPLQAGMRAPGVTVRDIHGQPFNLGSAFGKKPTVLIFYRGGWCPFCNRQMVQLQALVPKLRKMGYQMLAVSMDNPQHLLQSIALHHLTYTLLSDSSARAVKAYGIAFHVENALVAMYKKFHIDLDAASGNNHHILPVPSVFLVGTDDVIRYVYYNPDYKVRIAPDKLLAAAKTALKSSSSPGADGQGSDKT